MQQKIQPWNLLANYAFALPIVWCNPDKISWPASIKLHVYSSKLQATGYPHT